MFVVDTNILVYAANEDCPEHSASKDLVEDWLNQTGIWHLTWGICYEFLRVVTHRRVFQNPWSMKDAWGFIETLLSSPGLVILTETERHQETVDELVTANPYMTGNDVFDAHTAVLMKEHGIKMIYTRDTDFHTFAGITPVDPLASA